MKIKRSLQHLAILLGIIAAVFVGYELGPFSSVSTSTSSKYDVFGFPSLPPLTKIEVSPQTVDGITATIENAYADPRRVVFILRLSSNVGNYQSTETFLTDAKGDGISLSNFIVGPIPNETLTYLVEFNLADQLDETRLNGQLFLAFASLTDASHVIRFHFDFDLSIHPFLTFNPKKTISINGVDLLLDRLMIAPAHTFVYLCHPNRAHENWIITGESVVLNINKQNAALGSYEWLF